MSKIIEKFKEALQLDASYSYEKLQKEYEKLDKEEVMKVNLPLDYTLKDIFDRLKRMNGEDSICNYSKIGLDHRGMDVLCFADQYFKTALCMLLDRYEKKNHQGGEDALDKIVPKWLKKELQEPVEICETIIHIIVGGGSDADDVNPVQNQRIIGQIKFDARIALSKYVEWDIKKGKFSCIDLGKLYIVIRIFIFRMMLIEDENSDDENTNYYDQALFYLAFYFAQLFSEKDIPASGEGTYYARQAIKLNKIDDQQEAFNFLGLCAIGKGDYQLAYDTYYTWINRCCTGELEGEILPNFSKDQRKRFEMVANNSIEAILHHNFACLCSEISESYEFDSKSRQSFHKKAIQEIQKAIQMDDETLALSFSAYGDILLEGGYNSKKVGLKALTQYKKYMHLALQRPYIDQQMGAFRETSSAWTHLLVLKYLDEKEPSISEIFRQKEEYRNYRKHIMYTVSQYKEKFDDYSKENEKLDLDEREQREKWKCMFDLMDHLKEAKDSDSLQELQCLLLMIDQVATAIKKELEWKEYSPNKYQIRDADLEQDEKREGFPKVIAYYTTMDTIKHVFDELVQGEEGGAPHEKDADSNQEGRNCLTIMHAKYMNDPWEGLTLLNVFADEINNQVKDNIDKSLSRPSNKKVLDNVLWPGNAETFREEIYNNYFVFLKSFTEEEDNLIMWNRYASNRSIGGDSDGCFVKLDAESFGDTAYFCKNLAHGVQKKEKEPEDNFSLYHVVYISGNEIVDNNDSWKPSRNLKKYYSALKDMMCELNGYLCRQDVRNAVKKDDWKGFVEYISQFLQQSLRFIIFLFKDADYAEEEESRMVFTCRPNQQQIIRVLKKTTPEKLCVNPFFQIYFTEVVFGPNVKDRNVWEPYFQYHLNNMWKKNPSLKENPNIRPQDMYKIMSSEKHYRP